MFKKGAGVDEDIIYTVDDKLAQEVSEYLIYVILEDCW